MSSRQKQLTRNTKPIKRWILGFLHGLELQTQWDCHWFSLIDAFFEISKNYNCPTFRSEKQMCQWHFLTCPLLPFLYFCALVCLAFMPATPQVMGCRYEIWLPVNGRLKRVLQNCWFLFFYMLLTSPRDKPHSRVMRMHLNCKVHGSQLASWLTSSVSLKTKSGVYLLPWRALKYFSSFSNYPEAVCIEIFSLWCDFAFSFCQSWPSLPPCWIWDLVLPFTDTQLYPWCGLHHAAGPHLNVKLFDLSDSFL